MDSEHLPSFSLAGRVALVTGASRGIGRGLVDALASAGATVAVTARSRSDADVVATEVLATGGSASAHALDVSDVASIESAIDDVVDQHGRIDVLVANAGLGANHPALDVSERDWDEMMDVNAKGLFFTAQAAGRVMVAQGSGRIVAISSQASLVGIRDHAVYCASKGAVNQLVRVLALEWGAHGVDLPTVGGVSITGRPSRAVTEWSSGTFGTEGRSVRWGRRAVPCGPARFSNRLRRGRRTRVEAQQRHVVGDQLGQDASMGHQLEDVYDELAPSVLGYLRGRGCRDPEAVCGDVFVRVATKLSGFRGGDAALRRWVFTIAHNCLVDELRSASRHREIVTGELPETGLATASQEIDHELLGALGHLTDDQRDVIVLRYVADLPTRDVAKILGKRQGAIKMLQARGLATLRTALEELGRDA